MTSLKVAQASNARISTTLPAGLVAVFLGGTSGIGEYTLKQFAKYTVAPRVYFIGRSQEAADRITKECEKLNEAGSYIFIKADTSLIKNVDQVCEQIKSQEKTINLLFLTQGTLKTGVDTSEGLHLPGALVYYARTRFILNLLPLVQRATSLRRVVNVAVATKEGEVDTSDWERRQTPSLKGRAHGASLITLSMEKLASLAPNVSFVHNFPGWVRGGVARDNTELLWKVYRFVSATVGPFLMVPDEECGERQLFLATSAMFPAREPGADGIPLAESVKISRSIDGNEGGGVYSVNYDTRPATPQVEQLLARLKQEGINKQLWDHTTATFERITGERPVV